MLQNHNSQGVYYISIMTFQITRYIRNFLRTSVFYWAKHKDIENVLIGYPKPSRITKTT